MSLTCSTSSPIGSSVVASPSGGITAGVMVMAPSREVGSEGGVGHAEARAGAVVDDGAPELATGDGAGASVELRRPLRERHVQRPGLRQTVDEVDAGESLVVGGRGNEHPGQVAGHAA